MSWMKKLYEVYEHNKVEVGEFIERGKNQRFTLIPLSHVSQNAQIEVILDERGEFFQATVVPKEDSSTIVPATLDSANRSGSKIAPHFIHDKLSYVAGDYIEYGGNEKRAKHYKEYMNQLKDWKMSKHNHPYVKLIFNYLNQQRLIQDLIEAEVLFTNEDNQLIHKWTSKETEKYQLDKPEIFKVVAGNSSDAFVRFRIITSDSSEPVFWENTDIYACFQDYLAERMEEDELTGYCYVTGEKVPLTERHGSRLRNAGDMSKLISSNDDRGFTYRGRFKKASEAVQIGYEVSQKAHNALRWLIQKQGIRSDTRNFITFGVKTPEVVQPFGGSIGLISDVLTTSNNNNQQISTKLIAGEIKKAFEGKRHNFNIKGMDEIIVMAVDAATTGRLAIVYYQEMKSQLFLDYLSYWHETCKWNQVYYDSNTKKRVQYVGTPSTDQIVQSVYGQRADDRLKKELYTRLLPCIVNGMPIPKDIVRTIFNRVKNPMSFDGNHSSPTSDWQRSLNVACSLIYKQYEREVRQVELDINNETRDYLFGRLLGVAEVLERNELNARDESRATNATRYFNAFSQRPARTWMTIRRQLHPYLVRQSNRLGYYHSLIQDIEASLDPKDMTNKALSPLFLLGYSSQVKSLYTKNESKKENINASN